MKADFRRAHADMGRRTKAERQGFVKTLGHEVASLMDEFIGPIKPWPVRVRRSGELP